jgi:hypothetical protein
VNFVRVIVPVLAVLLAAASPLHSGETTKKSKATPAPATGDEQVFAPTDLEGLRPRLERRVVVAGKISGQGQSRKGTIFYLNFTKDFRKSVSLVFFANRGKSEFTKENLARYVGKKVRVGGLLSEYNGALQIQILTLEQIRVLP